MFHVIICTVTGLLGKSKGKGHSVTDHDGRGGGAGRGTTVLFLEPPRYVGVGGQRHFSINGLLVTII
jgi:hypothetical protein